VVIAVDVSAPLKTKAELGSVLAVVDQTISLQMVRSTREQAEIARRHGVLITPDLHDLGSTDFDLAEKIMRRGEEAARASPELRALAARLARYPSPPPRPSVTVRSAAGETVTIQRVEFEGAVQGKQRQMLKRLGISAGRTLTAGEIEKGLASVFGSSYFRSVDFRIEPGTAQGSILVIRAKEKAPEMLGIGARYSDQYGGIGLVELSAYGLGGPDATLSTEIQFGGLLAAQSTYSRYGLIGPDVFVRPRLFYRSAFQYAYSDDSRTAQYQNQATGIDLALGDTFQKWGEVALGYRWERANFYLDFGEPTLPEAHDNVASLYVTSHVDTLDRFPFPRSGARADLSYEHAQKGFGGNVTFDRVSFDDEHFWSIGDRYTLRLSSKLGSSLDSTLPVYDAYLLGGTDFVGYDWDALRGNHMAALSLGLRYRLGSLPLALGRDFYLTLRTNVGNTWNSLSDLDQGPVVRYGGSVGLALDTVLGPITLDFAHGDEGRSFVYFSAGYPF
jgi:NTE family protein